MHPLADAHGTHVYYSEKASELVALCVAMRGFAAGPVRVSADPAWSVGKAVTGLLAWQNDAAQQQGVTAAAKGGNQHEYTGC
jgi:hypothetical protein